MRSFIHNVALLASLVALSAGLCQDWGVWLTLKRMLISYVGFFFYGSLLSGAILLICRLENSRALPPAVKAAQRRQEH